MAQKIDIKAHTIHLLLVLRLNVVITGDQPN
ncbi:hypothetical protein V6Z12_A04G068100 [Gossypium hirsutum]